MSNEMKNRVKDLSLNYGEQGTKLAINYVFDLLKVVIEETENKIDDAFLPTLLSLKPIVIAYADKMYVEKEQ